MLHLCPSPSLLPQVPAPCVPWVRVPQDAPQPSMHTALGVHTQPGSRWAGLRVPPSRPLDLGLATGSGFCPPVGPAPLGGQMRPSVFRREHRRAGWPVPSYHQDVPRSTHRCPCPGWTPGWAGLPLLTPCLPPGPSTIPSSVLQVSGLSVAWHVMCHLVTCSPGR